MNNTRTLRLTFSTRPKSCLYRHVPVRKNRSTVFAVIKFAFWRMEYHGLVVAVIGPSVLGGGWSWSCLWWSSPANSKRLILESLIRNNMVFCLCFTKQGTMKGQNANLNVAYFVTCWFYYIKMVEAAGVEPASENFPIWHLHTYPEVWLSPLTAPSGWILKQLSRY